MSTVEKGKRRSTALHRASRHGDIPIVSKLLNENHSSVNLPNKHGRTPLHLAARAGNSELVSLLLEKGATVDSLDDLGRTPLHLACKCESPDSNCVRKLLSNGAHVDIKDANGYQPMDYAAQNEHDIKCHWLQQSGADISPLYSAHRMKGKYKAILLPDEIDKRTAGDVEEEWSRLCRLGTTAESTMRNRKRSSAIEREMRRERKWMRMLKDWDHTVNRRSKTLQRRCRKGIPDSFRGRAWQLLCGSDKARTSNERRYGELLQQESTHTAMKQIDNDVQRTFRDNPLFQQRYGLGQRSLYNVLKAYSIYDRNVEYCQGMSDVAGRLLMYMEEEQAFWVLVQLINHPNYGLGRVYGSASMREAFKICDRLVHLRLPKVAQHLDENCMDTYVIGARWFICLYIGSLSPSLVLRTWDLFFSEGYSSLFSVALCLFRLHQDRILERNFDEIIKLFGSRDAMNFDPDVFISYCHKHYPLDKSELVVE